MFLCGSDFTVRCKGCGEKIPAPAVPNAVDLKNERRFRVDIDRGVGIPPSVLDPIRSVRTSNRYRFLAWTLFQGNPPKDGNPKPLHVMHARQVYDFLTWRHLW
jgi:hypothetical protein